MNEPAPAIDRSPAQRQVPPLLKIALDVGPLVLFFAIYAKFGIFPATGILMAAVIVALAVSYLLTRHIAVMPLVTAGVVLVFGGLTLFFHNDLFIKLKPTIIYVLFGGALLIGLAFGKPLLGIVFDAVFNLTDEGWRKLTLRWALFFLFLAGLNEAVWRTQSTDFWVNFKVFGVVVLTFVFAAAQYPLMQRYEVKDEAAETGR